MLPKIWLVNLLLAVFAVYFGVKAYGIWSEGGKGSPVIQPTRKSVQGPQKKIAKSSMPPESQYTVVVSTNLFSPDRLYLDPQETKTEPDSETEISPISLRNLKRDLKKIVLYGVILMDGREQALITNIEEKVPKKGGPRLKKPTFVKRVKWIKVGDSVDGFKIKEIHKEKIKLTASGQEFQISLYDNNKVQKREAVKKEAGPTVISVGSRMQITPKTVTTTPKKEEPKPTFLKKKTPTKSKVVRKKAPSKKPTTAAQGR